MEPAGAPQLALVVEDEWILRATIVEELRGAGWEVVQTAENAIAYAHADHIFDVVLTDVRLAVQLTGRDVAAHVRGFCADLPIIYASGSSVDRWRTVAGSLFFDKPYDLAEVVAARGRFM